MLVNVSTLDFLWERGGGGGVLRNGSGITYICNPSAKSWLAIVAHMVAHMVAPIW
jgi:hypothetical protein